MEQRRPGISHEYPYLDLRVGPYRIALRTPAVVAIGQDVPSSGENVVDLRTTLCGIPPRAVLPYGLVVDDPLGPLTVGVDAIGQLGGDSTGSTVPIPPLGLRAPQLFEGALRHDGGLSLLVHADALLQVVRNLQ